MKEMLPAVTLKIQRIAEDLDPEKAPPVSMIPDFWVDGEKVLEGIPCMLTLLDVLEGVLNDEDASRVKSAGGGERLSARSSAGHGAL